MQPKSITVLTICALVALAAFAVGILLDLQVLDRHIFWMIVKNGGPLAALTFGAVHYFRSRPRIFDYQTSDWQQTGENWTDVSIRIPESKHRRGKSPTVTFLTYNYFVRDFGLTYKIEPNGDIIICHLENQFMPPWKSFRVKITT